MMALESERSPAEERRSSAFHRIELLTRPERYPVLGVLPRIVPASPPFATTKSLPTFPSIVKSPDPPTPPAENAASPGLSFSVDNILKPEFGRPTKRRQTTSPVSLPSSSPPPRKPHGDEVPSPTKIDPVIPDDPNGPVWPAWVYCTRYSDRPSSGRLYPFRYLQQ